MPIHESDNLKCFASHMIEWAIKPDALTRLVSLAASDMLPMRAAAEPQAAHGVGNDKPAKIFSMTSTGIAVLSLEGVMMRGESKFDDTVSTQALRQQIRAAANDEDVMESSYSLIKGLIWAIPVLGFIGTVEGLSKALGKFGGVLEGAKEISKLTASLSEVTGGLNVAFQTTFIALVAALVIQLILTIVRKGEEELLDDCREYCQRYIVGKLRLTPFDR